MPMDTAGVTMDLKAALAALDTHEPGLLLGATSHVDAPEILSRCRP